MKAKIKHSRLLHLTIKLFTCKKNLQQQKTTLTGSENHDSGQFKKQIDEKEIEIKQLKEQNQRAQSETERLLQLMQMTQEEQFSKDKTIMELQEYKLK